MPMLRSRSPALLSLALGLSLASTTSASYSSTPIAEWLADINPALHRYATSFSADELSLRTSSLLLALSETDLAAALVRAQVKRPHARLIRNRLEQDRRLQPPGEW